MSTMLQKAITPQMTKAYLEKGMDRVAGYVVRAADVAAVTTTAGLFELHGLGFAGTPFSADRPIEILHMPASPTASLFPATGGTDDEGRRATGGKFLERPPFSGTGFASADDVVVPLQWLEHTRLTPGSRLWRFHPDRDEPELIGTYHGVAFGWQNHLDDDTFHVAKPSKLVGHLATLEDGTYAADIKVDDDGKPTVVTIVTSAPDAEEHGFTRTAAGTWAKQLLAADVPELFEMHASARWHGIPVRIVDQAPNEDGTMLARIGSLAHDAEVAEKLGMDKVDPGVYTTTVPVAALTDVVYAQRVPRGWAKPEQLKKRAAAAAAAQQRQGLGAAGAGAGAGAAAGVAAAPAGPGTPGSLPPGADPNSPAAKVAAELQRVILGLVKVAPEGWTRLRMLCRMVGSHGEFLAAATHSDGTERPLGQVPADVANAFAEMRLKAYEPGKGTWFAAMASIEKNGKFSIAFDSTSEVAWARPPRPGQYSEDLRRFPRDDEHIPDWLKQRLAADSTPEIDESTE